MVEVKMLLGEVKLAPPSPMRVCRADLTGALITLASAACPSMVGMTGLVVMETKNTLQIIMKDNKLR